MASEASVVYVNVDTYKSKVELIAVRSDGISTYSDDLYSDHYRIETNSKRCRVVHIRRKSLVYQVRGYTNGSSEVWREETFVYRRLPDRDTYFHCTMRKQNTLPIVETITR